MSSPYLIWEKNIKVSYCACDLRICHNPIWGHWPLSRTHYTGVWVLLEKCWFLSYFVWWLKKSWIMLVNCFLFPFCSFEKLWNLLCKRVFTQNGDLWNHFLVENTKYWMECLNSLQSGLHSDMNLIILYAEIHVFRMSLEKLVNDAQNSKG